MTWGEALRMAEILAGVSVVIAVCPPLRRVVTALAKAAKTHAPRWLAPILGPLLIVCVILPGQVDELAVIAVALAPVLRTRAGRAEVWASIRAAWKG